MTVVLLYIDMKNMNTVHVFFTYYKKAVSGLLNLYIFASCGKITTYIHWLLVYCSPPKLLPLDHGAGHLNFNVSFMYGAHGGTVGWDTAVRAGRLWVWSPMVSLEFFIDNPSGHTVALGSTQPLKEVSTRNISWWVKVASALGWQPDCLHVTVVLKSGILTLCEPPGPAQACNGIAYSLCTFCGGEKLEIVQLVSSNAVSVLVN